MKCTADLCDGSEQCLLIAAMRDSPFNFPILQDARLGNQIMRFELFWHALCAVETFYFLGT